MENVSTLVYCNGDMIPTDEGVVFKCPTNPKVITINEDILLAVLRKTIFDANGGSRIVIDFFLRSINLYR